MLAHVVVFLAVEGDSSVRFERAYCDRESKEASVVAVYPCVTGGCCIGVNTRVCCVLGTTCRCLSLSQARFGSPGLPATHHLDRRDGGLVSVHSDLSEADLS